MSENTVATRAELIKLRSKITLAKNGHRLLKKKRDGLVIEFFKLLDRARTLREELDSAYRESLSQMNKARVLEGDIRVKSIALSVREIPVVNMGTRNIVGVTVPRVEANKQHRNYGLFDSIAITEAAFGYGVLIEKIIIAAEVETSIRTVLAEIEKTKRRVNALEFEIVPSLLATKAHILLRLDELERENFYRLKISKKRISEAV